MLSEITYFFSEVLLFTSDLNEVESDINLAAITKQSFAILIRIKAAA